MRVAFLGDTTHPNAVNWIADLVDLFGIELEVVDFETPDLGPRPIAQHRLDAPRSGKLRYVAAVPATRRLLRRIRPDLTVAYRVTSYGFLAAAAGASPLVIAGQGQNIVSSESPAGSRWFTKYALRRADLLLAWAEHMADAMVSLGAERERVLVSNRGVRTDRFAAEVPEPRPRRIVTSRQLAPYYRTEEIVEAVAKLARRGVDAELWVCGEGPERPRLEALVAEHRLGERVTLRGRLDHEALAVAYREASVYASMVPTDGVSSSLLEAMSAGLVPVVADNAPNRLWVGGGTHGRLVAPGDVEVLANALSDALDDVERRPEIRRANRGAIVSRADRRTNLARIVDRWRALVAERSGR